tara:strand:- start:1750 stop:3039 length:1290 start_codon:yes stop_codon:yes gene_type:complete
MYTEFLNHSEFKRKLNQSIKNIDDFLDSESNGVLLRDKALTSSLVQRYAYFKNDHIHDNIIKPLLLDAAVRSEQISGGAGDICLKILPKIIDDNCIFDSKVESAILDNSKRSNRKDFNKLVSKNSTCSDHKEIFSFLFENMNINSPIFIEKSKLSKTRIMLETGFKFDISVDKKFLTKNTKRMSNVRCFVIDGFIESVSEIHYVLEEAAKTKENYVLFVRHMDKDVESTIEYNIKRGTINLVPVCVGFDENTLNILNDISICTNSDLVSSTKGDTISQSVKRDPSIVDSIDFTNSSVSIVNKNPSSMIKSHLSYLREKREKSTNTSVFNLIENRIKSLSSGKIVVSIGTDLVLKEPRTVEIFDKILREIRSLVRSGVIYLNCLDSDMSNKFSLDLDYPYSPLSLIVAIKNSKSIASGLKSISGVIYEDI